MTVRLIVRLVKGYIKNHLWFFFLGIFASCLIIFLLPGLAPRIFPKRPQTISLVGNFTPQTLPLSLRRQISFGLTQLTATGQATSAAATSWIATDSGRTIIFHLDQNLFWQDGTKFDASQVIYNLKGVTLEKTGLYEVRLSLKDTFAPLTTVVSEPLFKSNLIGLGPTTVISLRTSGRFLDSLTLKNSVTNTTVIYKFYPSESQALTALRLGAIDQAADLRLTTEPVLGPRFQTTSRVDKTTLVTAFFNLNQKFLEEKSIRQALVYALPDEFTEGQIADGPISPDNWAYSDSLKAYPQDLSLAQKTLAASSSAVTKFNIVYPQALESVAQKVATAWQSVGLPAKLIASDVPVPNFDVYITYVDLPADPDQYALWHSTQRNNISSYRSFRVDRLLEEGRTTLDPVERQKIYANFQRALTEDVPATFLYFPRLYTISRE